MSDWPRAQLRHIARFAYGESLAAESRRTGEVAVYGSNGPVGLHDLANTAAPVIVIGRKGSHGKLNYADSAVFAIDTTFFVDETTTRTNVRWLYYALSTAGLDTLSQDVGVPGLSREEAYKQSIPLPPTLVQRKIADYLDTETARIDALINKKRRMIELLEERRKATLAARVTGQGVSEETRATSIPWAPELPASWGEVALKLVAALGSGHTPSRAHPEWWLPEDCVIPWVTTGEVSQMRSDRQEYLSETREKISELGMANSSARLHAKGSVVMSRTASPGYSAILQSDMATSQDMVVWACGPRLRPRYLLLCLRAMRADLLGRLAIGSTHKTIYMPDVESIRVPLPSLEEQDEIVESVWRSWSHIDHLVATISSQVDLLAERRQAMITAGVTGELKIPGVEE